LGSANAASRSNPVTQPQGATTTSNASGFVFGQNLSERVMMQENINNGEASSDHSSTNGTTELLFTNAAASVKENNQEAEASTSEAPGETSLAAAAAEYERIHARPPPPAANFSHTGEEGEINVLQGAPVDITQLHRALMSRVAVSKRSTAVSQCAQNASSQQAAERLEADYPDKADDAGEPDKHTDHEPNDRLEPPKQTEEYESNVDGMLEEKEPIQLKRKEPIEDETSPKRQRPDIVTE
ncbi:Ran-binding protein 3, partial [Operophtera brumata]